MSRLTLATMADAGTVGAAMYAADPSSPSSSPLTARNSTDLRGGVGSAAIASATSSSTAVPDALSSAPLKIESPLTSGGPVPTWS